MPENTEVTDTLPPAALINYGRGDCAEETGPSAEFCLKLTSKQCNAVNKSGVGCFGRD